jgi:hypothetical protein
MKISNQKVCQICQKASIKSFQKALIKSFRIKASTECFSKVLIYNCEKLLSFYFLKISYSPYFPDAVPAKPVAAVAHSNSALAAVGQPAIDYNLPPTISPYSMHVAVVQRVLIDSANQKQFFSIGSSLKFTFNLHPSSVELPDPSSTADELLPRCCLSDLSCLSGSNFAMYLEVSEWAA